MDIKKPSIPGIATMNYELSRILSPMKANIELITGASTAPLPQLPATASSVDVINKINDIISRLNQAGQ